MSSAQEEGLEEGQALGLCTLPFWASPGQVPVRVGGWGWGAGGTPTFCMPSPAPTSHCPLLLFQEKDNQV